MSSGPSPRAVIGVDVGGTFTDTVAFVRSANGSHIVSEKFPTTPKNQSQGVLAAVDALLTKAKLEPAQVDTFAVGMTVTTNALLESRVAPTALITTAGFEDVLELRRQTRPKLYELCVGPPPPLVPRELRYGVSERMTPDGPLLPLDRASATAAIEQIKGSGVQAVAVALLHSYRYPEHELAIAELLAELAPDLHVSLSSQVVGTFREYERTATTVADAALSPLLAGYLSDLISSAQQRGLPAPAVVQSSGGLIAAELARKHAALTVLSGPAGGAVGAALSAQSIGAELAICFDMGGTSCDVCTIESGRVTESSTREIAGRPIALPAVDVHTVGAGGGSIAKHDGSGALQVGPSSAGAVPGPAAYGRGGTAPTVTDANAVLGYFSTDADLAGGLQLDRQLAQQAVEALADKLDLTTVECAAGIRRVANETMAQAIRVITVERGLDPREYALLSFGGAGPLHGCALAELLEIERIICPLSAGVLSAFGIATGDLRRDAQRSLVLAPPELTDELLHSTVAELVVQAKGELGAGESAPLLECEYDVRFVGQAHELTVRTSPAVTVNDLAELLAAAHTQRYGFTPVDGTLEVVTVRAVARIPGEPPATLRTPSEAPAKQDTQRAWFGGQEMTTVSLLGVPTVGEPVIGPAVISLDEATVLVEPGWQATQRNGAIELVRSK